MSENQFEAKFGLQNQRARILLRWNRRYSERDRISAITYERHLVIFVENVSLTEGRVEVAACQFSVGEGMTASLIGGSNLDITTAGGSDSSRIRDLLTLEDFFRHLSSLTDETDTKTVFCLSSQRANVVAMLQWCKNSISESLSDDVTLVNLEDLMSAYHHALGIHEVTDRQLSEIFDYYSKKTFSYGRCELHMDYPEEDCAAEGIGNICSILFQLLCHHCAIALTESYEAKFVYKLYCATISPKKEKEKKRVGYGPSTTFEFDKEKQ